MFAVRLCLLGMSEAAVVNPHGCLNDPHVDYTDKHADRDGERSEDLGPRQRTAGH